MALGKFLYRHSAWLEYDVLSVVKLPVFGEDATFAFQARMQRRAWKRRQHCKTWQIHACIKCELHSCIKDVGRIVIKPKHETALHGNSEVMQISYHLFEIN